MSSPQSFEDTCLTIFENIINTVPIGTVLSDVIGPRPWIMREKHLDLLPSGAVTFSGSITANSKGINPNTASYYYATSAGVNAGTKISELASTKEIQVQDQNRIYR